MLFPGRNKCRRLIMSCWLIGLRHILFRMLSVIIANSNSNNNSNIFSQPSIFCICQTTLPFGQQILPRFFSCFLLLVGGKDLRRFALNWCMFASILVLYHPCSPCPCQTSFWRGVCHLLDVFFFFICIVSFLCVCIPGLLCFHWWY